MATAAAPAQLKPLPWSVPTPVTCTRCKKRFLVADLPASGTYQTNCPGCDAWITFRSEVK